MNRHVFLLSISILSMLACSVAQATSLTFDDLPPYTGDGSAITKGYGGLNWNNLHYIAPEQRYGTGNSGYYYGIISPINVAFNGGANPATVSGAPFTFNSAYFTGAWNDGLDIQVKGYIAGVLVQSTTFSVSSATPTFKEFNWSGVDQLVFSSSGGVDHGYGHSGRHFVMDNMTINAVPEPSTFILLAVAAICLLFSLRKNKIV